MVENGICHAVHTYAKANNKDMKNYDKNKEYSFIEYLHANNLYGWAMSQKLPVDGFKWKKITFKFNENFVKNYHENNNKGYVFEVDVKYPKKIHDLQSDLPFLPERIKINKCNELVCNLCDKNNCVVHIRSLKEVLNHGLILRKVYRVIQFNQKLWLKEYINKNTELRKQGKNDFEKDFFKLKHNSLFGKTMENERKHRDIKLVTTDTRRNQLVSKPNYHTTKWCSENLNE